MGNPPAEPRETSEQTKLWEIEESDGLGRYDLMDRGSMPTKEAQEPLASGFRTFGSILLAVTAVLLLAIPVLWALGALLAGIGVFGPGITPLEWDWLLAALFVLLAGVVGLLYFTLFAKDFGGRPTG